MDAGGLDAGGLDGMKKEERAAERSENKGISVARVQSIRRGDGHRTWWLAGQKIGNAKRPRRPQKRTCVKQGPMRGLPPERGDGPRKLCDEL